MAELDSMVEAVADQLAGASILAVVRQLKRGGASANQALRLAAFVALNQTQGRDVLEEIGIAEGTATRWRKEAREFLAAGEAEAQQDGMNLVPVLAHQMASALAKASSEAGHHVPWADQAGGQQ